MAQTTISARTPTDGIVTYQRILVERAPDVNGAPGTFVQIVNVAIDQYNEYTDYTDTTGTVADWYRYRYANTALLVYSDYSDVIQAGDYIIRQWIMADIPDTDLTKADWDRWRDEVLADLSVKYVGRPIYPPQSITPAGYTTEYYPLTGDIRKVIRVDIYDSAGFFVSGATKWSQFGRYLRIIRPQPSLTYKVYGLGLLRDLSDLDDELFMILYWGMRIRYLDRRLAERANWRFYLSSDKGSDVPLHDLEAHRTRAQSEFDSRLTDIRQTYSVPMSS